MLERVYSEGLVKGLITGTFQEWRQEVIRRINNLFNTGKEEMTDEEIMEYFKDEPYEKMLDKSSLRLLE